MPQLRHHLSCLYDRDWETNINQKQQKELDKLFAVGEDLHVLIMNVEAFSTKKGVEFAAKFLRCHRTIMAIDESTKLKIQMLKELDTYVLLESTQHIKEY